MTQEPTGFKRNILASRRIKAVLLSMTLLTTQGLSHKCLAGETNSGGFNYKKSPVLLAQGYVPGQPIKLHNYGSHDSSSSSAQPAPSLSQPAVAPSSFSNSGSSNTINDRLPDLIPPMNVTEPSTFAQPFSSAGNHSAPAQSGAQSGFPPASSTDSSVSFPSGEAPNLSGAGSDASATTSTATGGAAAIKNKEKHPPKVHSQSGLSSKLKHFAGGVVNAAPDVLTGAAQGYNSGSAMPYQQGSSSSNFPRPGGGGSSPSRPGGGGIALGGEIGMELNKALQAEKAGDYDNAAHEFWYTCDLAIGGLGFKERTDFWENGNIGPFKCKDLYKRALNCHVIMYRRLIGQGKPNSDGSPDDSYAVPLFKDLSCMELCDSQDASWYYLHAINDISVDKQELGHARGFWQLGLCMHCPNCSPELKKKCEVLRNHIRLAGILELADENRAKFANMAGQVWGQEHNTVSIYTDSSGRVTHVIDPGAGMYRYYYPLMKEMLKNDYPKFKADYDKLLAYIHSLPNNAVAIPPGDGTPSIVEFNIVPNEKFAYGPVVYRTGGHF